jgi:hypothetical protein
MEAIGRGEFMLKRLDPIERLGSREMITYLAATAVEGGPSDGL